jgi:hypothetical protein
LDSDTAPDSAYAVWGDGSYIYVADRTDGFHIYSFDGTTLTLEESSTTGSQIEHVWGDGTYIYFADNAAAASGRLYTFSYNGSVLSLVETVSLRTSKVWGDGTHLYSLSSGNLNIFSTGVCYGAGASGNDNLGNHTATLPLNMSTNKITGLGDPTLAQDAATKAYVDASGGSDNLGDHTATEDLKMGNFKVDDVESVIYDSVTGNEPLSGGGGIQSGVDTVAISGAACTDVGKLGRTASGVLLVCEDATTITDDSCSAFTVGALSISSDGQMHVCMN